MCKSFHQVGGMTYPRALLNDVVISEFNCTIFHYLGCLSFIDLRKFAVEIYAAPCSNVLFIILAILCKCKGTFSESRFMKLALVDKFIKLRTCKISVCEKKMSENHLIFYSTLPDFTNNLRLTAQAEDYKPSNAIKMHSHSKGHSKR